MENEALQTIEYSGKQVRIIEAAERLFSEHGFDGTSVRDIAQQAGVNLAMISYYFGSKENLLHALFNYRISESFAILESIVNDKALGPVEKVRAMIDYYVDRIVDNQCFHKITIREQIGHDPSNPISKVMRENKLRNFGMVKKIVSEGVRKKLFTKTADLQMLWMTMMGTIYQILGSQQHYRMMSGLDDLTEPEFQLQVKKRLKTHLKHIFIAALTYENHQ